MASSYPRGLRVLSGLAGLFLLVTSAWLAQRYLVNQIQRDREHAPDLLSEGGKEVPLERGWGRIVLGAPSGVRPRPRPRPQSTAPYVDLNPGGQAVNNEQQPGARSTPIALPRWPADLELVVRHGQSLSKIAAAEYGRATEELVRRLALYNGLSNPNKLRTGKLLNVPAIEKLLAQD